MERKIWLHPLGRGIRQVADDGTMGCVFLLNLCVQDVEWLKSITSLPILLKGIVTAEDGNE
jgi:hypothetical protein